MSKGQQPPTVVVKQPSQESELDPSDQNSFHKVLVARSNSAPQAQGRFPMTKMDFKSKIGSSSPKRQIRNGGQNIPTLSDGVICVNHEQAAQAAANVMSSHQGSPVSGNAFDSQIQMSPTPLCDSNHSPSSTKRFYREASPLFVNEPKPDDVWQRRDQLALSGHSDSTHITRSANNNDLKEKEAFVFPASDNMKSEHNGSNGNSHDIIVEDQPIPNGSTKAIEDEVEKTEEKEVQLSSPQSEAEVGLRKHPPLRECRQAQSEVILPSEMQRKMSLANVKGKGYARLEEELMKAQKALEMKDEEVDELRGIRERLMKEVSDFTASLFEEVNSQLNEAALSEQQARKQLQEANTKIEVLSAEVVALKNLVLTSTPATPNKHLHPQIDTAKKEKGGKPFWKTHRRSTSHHQFTKESREKAEATEHHSQLKELDTVVFDEFSRWRLQPTMEFSGQFFTRVHMEDIQPCLNFKNVRLAEMLQESVKKNTLCIEPIPGDHSFPRKCSLSDTHKLCNYKIRFEGDEDWYSISQMARNRITAVCDFYAYLRYIVQGLVKCSDKDMYAELVRLRSQMSQARLGLI